MHETNEKCRTKITKTQKVKQTKMYKQILSSKDLIANNLIRKNEKYQRKCIND